MENVTIREIRVDEYGKLEDMMYEAVFQADESNPIPRTVLEYPIVNMYIKDFGTLPGDYCLVADVDGEVIGAVWVRVLLYEIEGFGKTPDNTPEIVISLYKPYRCKGIGTRLMLKMLIYLKKKGYPQVFLKVEKPNYAVQLYRKLGFKFIGENDEDYFMLLDMDNYTLL